MGNSPGDVARALYRALEQGRRGEELSALFADDALTVTHPNAIQPRGSRAGLEEILAASEAGAALLARQSYEVHSILEVGDVAVVRLRWTGVVGRAVGPFHEGQRLVAHIAQFVETRGGRVASIETFDCYEPIEERGRSAISG